MEYNKENQPPCYDCVMWLRRGAMETKEGRLPAERYCRQFPDVHDVIKRREITNNFECFRKRKCDTDRKSEMWQRANRLNGAFSDLPAEVRCKVFADMAEMERRNIKVKREEVDKELFDAVFVHLKKKYKR